MKTKKTNDPITLVERKRETGGTTLYLVYYVGGKRKRESLKLHLTGGKSPADKEKDKQTEWRAKEIKTQKLLELQNNDYKLPANKSKKMLFEYIKDLAEFKRTKTGKDRGSYQSYMALLNNISKYHCDIRITEIDKEYCRKFISYLRQKGLSANTIAAYCAKLKYVLDCAIDDEIINKTPFRIRKEDRPKKEKAKVNYFDKAEVDRLIATPCTCNNVKNAFLFSCFTGLRLSDVESFTKADIQLDPEGQEIISKRIEKTDNWQSVPYVQEAKDIVMKQTPVGDKIFPLKSRVHTGITLKQWALSAGITKKVSFHVSRHTYATLMLSTGATVTTVQKNLGHKDLSSTMIYAATLPQAQWEAALNLGGLFKGQIAEMQ